ncbi:regulatory protein RecX [Pseudoclavibacter albus]|uniref:regulatory protein RecX n=1 Tax=Pseudoclavibacter albus TaxID=272241 RepID=UPI00082690D0|nr:regulatory protein RecX [Pseudoclavibacter alba]
MAEAEIIAFPGAHHSGEGAADRGADSTIRTGRTRATVEPLSARINDMEAAHGAATAPGPAAGLPWSAASSQPVLPGEDRALSILRRGDKTRAELEAKLREDDSLDEAAREAVLDRMDEYGYLNDTRVAENLVNKLLHRQGKGRMLVERELRQRGISDTVIEEVLAGEDRDDEFLRARACAEDRARRLRGLDDVTAQRRLVSYLQRRGFTSGVAFRAAEDALNGNDRGIASGEPRRGVFFEPSDA